MKSAFAAFSFVGILSSWPIPVQAEVLTWDCNFNKRVDENGTTLDPMRLIFRIDSVSQKAFMEGNAGIVEVGLHIGGNAFSFTERLASGVIQTTTITRDGIAVHSRHTVLLGEILPAQHLGRCAPK